MLQRPGADSGTKRVLKNVGEFWAKSPQMIELVIDILLNAKLVDPFQVPPSTRCLPASACATHRAAVRHSAWHTVELTLQLLEWIFCAENKPLFLRCTVEAHGISPILCSMRRAVQGTAHSVPHATRLQAPHANCSQEQHADSPNSTQHTAATTYGRYNIRPLQHAAATTCGRYNILALLLRLDAV